MSDLKTVKDMLKKSNVKYVATVYKVLDSTIMRKIIRIYPEDNKPYTGIFEMEFDYNTEKLLRAGGWENND